MIVLLKNRFNIEVDIIGNSNEFGSISNEFMGFDPKTQTYKTFKMLPNTIYTLHSFTISTDYSLGNGVGNTFNPIGSSIGIYERVAGLPFKDYLGVYPIPFLPSEYQIGQDKKSLVDDLLTEVSTLYFDVSGTVSGVGTPEDIDKINIGVFLKIEIDQRNIEWGNL